MKLKVLIFVTLIVFTCVKVEVVGKKIRPNKKVQFVPSAPQGPLLESSKVVEAGCITRKGIKSLNPNFINKSPAWYVPMASKHFYYKWGEALINRSLGESEMAQLCLKWLFLAPTTPRGQYNVVVGGYHNAVTQLCQDTGYVTESCDAVKGAPEYHRGVDNVGTIVDTDNASWFLLVRCVQKQVRDWAVFSTARKTINTVLSKTIMLKVRSLGFDLRFAELLKYDRCPKMM